MEKLRVIKEKIKDANVEIAEKNWIIDQLCTPSCHSIILNSNRIMVLVDKNKDIDPKQGIDELSIVGFLKPCALCTKGFPSKDVIMATCGCNYHRWCCVTQNWLSQNCAAENCKMPFIKA